MKAQVTVRARSLRRLQTKQEYELWQKLRNRQLEGIKFRRQVPIWNYIADFVSNEKKIIIEVDGRQHNKKLIKVYDMERTQALELKGFKVLRFWNNDISNSIDGVLEKIRSALIPTFSQREKGK